MIESNQPKKAGAIPAEGEVQEYVPKSIDTGFEEAAADAKVERYQTCGGGGGTGGQPITSSNKLIHQEDITPSSQLIKVTDPNIN